MVPKYIILIIVNVYINIVIAQEYQCAFSPVSKDEMSSRWKFQIKQMLNEETTKLKTQLENKIEEKFATVQRSSQSVEWVDTTHGNAKSLLGRAVLGGYETDGNPMLIVKGIVQNTVVIGKLNLYSKEAFYAYKSDEYHLSQDSDVTKVLCAPPERVRWVESRNGFVPPNAVIGGSLDYGDRIYIGRVKQQGSLIPGPIVPNDKALYITFGGKRIKHEVYEVLCLV